MNHIGCLPQEMRERRGAPSTLRCRVRQIEGHDDVSWINVLPDVLVCAGLFFAPGLLATYLGGLRGITAWATAPLVTVAVVAAVAVLGGWFNFRFGLWSAGAGMAVMACLAAAL